MRKGPLATALLAVFAAIGAVVIRGGVVDGDHCDPRAERRRRGVPEILVNNRGPVLRGNF